jgi:hypothetical protein
MAANALKKITARAKQIYKKGGTWKTAIKKAGAEYRGGKKVSGTKKKKSARRAVVKRVKSLHRAEGRAIKKLGSASSAFVTAAMGRLSTAQHISHAKQKIMSLIGVSESRKFAAKTKRAKNKIARRIRELKSKYNKLC